MPYNFQRIAKVQHVVAMQQHPPLKLKPLTLISSVTVKVVIKSVDSKQHTPAISEVVW